MHMHNSHYLMLNRYQLYRFYVIWTFNYWEIYSAVIEYNNLRHLLTYFNNLKHNFY